VGSRPALRACGREMLRTPVSQTAAITARRNTVRLIRMWTASVPSRSKVTSAQIVRYECAILLAHSMESSSALGYFSREGARRVPWSFV
jgi:hypothetical protein